MGMNPHLPSMDDDERCRAVCEDSHTNGNSTKSVVLNNIAVEEVVCSPPKKRLKKFDEEAIIMGERLTEVEINLAQRIQHQWAEVILNVNYALQLTKLMKINSK